MLRFSKIFLAATVALLLLWQLPWCYAFVASRPSSVPFTLYSPLAGDFISTGRLAGEGVVRADRSGRRYTERQADSLLPFFYFRQLVSDERFPDTLLGRPVSPREVQVANFTFRASARDLNCSTPGLYPLLESLSGRVDLSMPDDVFRITAEGMEFVRMAGNTIDRPKSDLFTQTLAGKGFRFPATRIAGNPTARKEYDEGYLLCDSGGSLFHLKQVCGRPYVRAIPLPEGVEVDCLFVTEFRSRLTRGLFTDPQGRLYVVDAAYAVRPTGVDRYDPRADDLLIIGNLADWTVRVDTEGAVRYYAIRADNYALIDTLTFRTGPAQVPGLHFTSSTDKYVRPRF